MNIHDEPRDSSVPGFFAASSTTSGKIEKVLGKPTEIKGSVFLQCTDGKIISASGKLLKNTKDAEKKALKDNKGTIITVKEHGLEKKVFVEINHLAHKLGLSEAEKKELSANPNSLQSVLAKHAIKTTEESSVAPLARAMQQAGLPQAEITKIQQFVDEHFSAMVRVATEKGGGAAKFSKRLPAMQARGINYSITVTKTGQVFIHAKTSLGKGGFKTASVNIGSEEKAVRAMQNRETVEHHPAMLKEEYKFHERFQGPGFMKVFGFLEYTSEKTKTARKGILSRFYPFDMKKIMASNDLKARMPPQAKISAITQLAAAITKMHSENVVHLDLKPENVYLKWNPDDPSKIEVGLGDFGAAQEVNKKSVKTMDKWASTPDYSPPEKMYYRAIATGLVKDVKRTFGVDIETLPKASDVFSLGKTFLEWNRGAFVSQDDIVKFGKGPSPADPVERLCWRMLQRELKDRPTAAEVFDILEQMSA